MRHILQKIRRGLKETKGPDDWIVKPNRAKTYTQKLGSRSREEGGIPWEIIRIGPKGTKVPDWDVYRIVDTFIMLIISGANSDDA
jgi:hypothetical protein